MGSPARIVKRRWAVSRGCPGLRRARTRGSHGGHGERRERKNHLSV